MMNKKIVEMYGYHVFFCQWVMLEEAKDIDQSEFGSYIDLWPNKISNFPVSFSDKELKWLEGSPFCQFIDVIKGSIV